MTLKDSINELYGGLMSDDEPRIPEDDEWIHDPAYLIAMKSESPRVKSAMYDRAKNKTGSWEDDCPIKYSPEGEETAEFSTEIIRDVIELHYKISESVDITLEKDKPIKIVSEDYDGDKTVTVIAPRIE